MRRREKDKEKRRKEVCVGRRKREKRRWSCCTCPCLSRNCISKLRSATDLSSWRLEQEGETQTLDKVYKTQHRYSMWLKFNAINVSLAFFS